MRYAVISDIHGNLPALEAVLEDARAQDCQRYLFLGDYVQDFPFPNQVVQRIRELPITAVIAGNKELDSLGRIQRMAAAGEYPPQFAALFWNIQEMTADTLSYLQSLPKRVNLPVENGTTLYLSHGFDDFFKSYCRWQHSSFAYSKRMETRPFTHTEFLAQMQQWLSQDTALKKELQSKPDGIYLFGHSHVQWHAQLDGKLLINPGSCGVPADYNPHTPYTILESHPDGTWSVQERRVPYNMELLSIQLRQSSLYQQAPFWCDLTLSCAKDSKDYCSLFFRASSQIAEAYGEGETPYSDYIWQLAVAHWYRQHGNALRDSGILPK